MQSPLRPCDGGDHTTPSSAGSGRTRHAEAVWAMSDVKSRASVLHLISTGMARLMIFGLQADLGTVPRAQAPWPLALRLSGGSYQHAAGARSVTVLDRAETAGDDESVARQGRLHGDEDKLQRRLARDLRRAAEHGDMRALAASLQAGVDVDVVDCSGFTALHIAAEKGHYDVVEELLTRGASVERREYISGWTPLHAAAYASQSRVVPVLVKHGAQVETVDYAGATAMLLACRAGCLHTIRALHSLNASIWAKQPDGSDVRSALQSNGELMTDECDAILAFLEEVASNQSETNTLRGRGPMRLSGGFAEATGAVDVASGESVPEPEGPPLPDPSHGPPPARSFLKVSEDGEIWVEKDGVVQEEKDRGDSLFPTSAAKVVESIDLGPDAVCACALCSGSDATVAGGGNLVGGVEGDSVDRQGGMHDAVIPQHLVKDFNDNLDAVCAEFRDGQAVAGARAEARADSSAEQHDGPQLPSGRCADKSSHRQGLTTRPIVSCSGPGWQFPGEWQQPRDSGLTVSAGEAEVAEGAGEVEWEDDSDPARFKCVGSVANGRIDDKILLDDLDAPVIDDTIRPRAASGMLSAARSEDTHAIARSAAVSAKTGIDDVQPEHGDWESAARASALRRGISCLSVCLSVCLCRRVRLRLPASIGECVCARVRLPALMGEYAHVHK